jgi:sodium/hydrogen exchanger 8
LASIVLGYASGLVVALISKHGLKKYIHRVNQEGAAAKSQSSEFGVMILVPWISYLIAEALNLTPMITIFFCGVSLGQYAIRNISRADRLMTERIFATISDLCQSISFIYIGVAFTGFGVDIR